MQDSIETISKTIAHLKSEVNKPQPVAKAYDTEKIDALLKMINELKSQYDQLKKEFMGDLDLLRATVNSNQAALTERIDLISQNISKKIDRGYSHSHGVMLR